MVMVAPPLTFRTIDPVADGEMAASHHRDACAVSFGAGDDCQYREDSDQEFRVESVEHMASI